MKKIIVTTTINPPTKALKLFAQKKGWEVIITGDLSTPHDAYRALEKKYSNVTYMSPEDQEKKYKKISDAIGWKKIQRRNIGYLEAYDRGAEIIATVDDDNIPLDGWGENIILRKKTKVTFYKTSLPVFDPIGATNYSHLWHRGYPLQLLAKRDYTTKEEKVVTPDIQADFWNGDPDIDAICRMEHAPECTFQNKYFPIASNKISPFNSQNTFLTRDVLKHYFLFNEVGRMDDIWASFYVQALGFNVVYTQASVVQARNVHDLTKDMKGEYLGYEHNLEMIKQLKQNPDNILSFLPKKAAKAFEMYLNYFK